MRIKMMEQDTEKEFLGNRFWCQKRVVKMKQKGEMMKAKERVIIALDYKDLDEVKKLVEELGDKIDFYKVGLEIFLNTNGSVIDYLHSLNKKVFLDLKFHDINNTTKMACEYAAKKEVFLFNIHATCGKQTMTEIAKMLKDTNSKSLCIAVTVLTNINQDEMREIYKTEESLEDMVMNLAVLTKDSNLHGIVCSAQEAREIKEKCGKDFLTICPGVRPEWAVSDDQKRVMTPGEAVKNGADYLVIGRPVTKAENPRKAAEMILEEIENVIV